ncbi:hatching enzyme 1.2 [Trichomycterus rosablanca]|uniref:hatching enzyme 1.2 n=1 Tax=Trichomycterus rosablanca TaxID=2290929 RepID=UPI002F352339
MNISAIIYSLKLLLLLQVSFGFNVQSARNKRSDADWLKQNEQTAMDVIININDFGAVEAVDGVKLREADIAVSSNNQKSCFAQTCLWSKSVDGHVYIAYDLSPQYSEVDRSNIEQGMKIIERDTCVRFIPRTHQRDFLDIQPKSGCWSYLGSSGGRQTLSLQTPKCMSSGIISHQLMHALGFVHEQSRADRDKYITIMWSNIWKDHVNNFEKFKMNNMDLPYDYGSIMHYGKYAFSEDGDPTIIPKRNWNVKLGQKFGPSGVDIMKINRLYKCN